MRKIYELRRYGVRLARRFSPDFGTGSESARDPDTPADGEVITTTKWRPESEVNPVGFDPDDLTNRADVVTELGLQPEEFLVQIVENQGGRLPQQAISDYTSWSETLISRVLQEMEDDGWIVRVPIGRKKIICLPERAPASDLDTPDGSDDLHRAF